MKNFIAQIILFMNLILICSGSIMPESYWIRENGYGAYCVGDLPDAAYDPQTCILCPPQPDIYYRWDPVQGAWVTNIDMKKAYMRLVRDQELRNTDKYILPDDFNLLSKTAQKAMIAYRQALRDVPNHDDINQVVMPTPVDNAILAPDRTVPLIPWQFPIQTVTVTLTNAQIKALHATPITLIPAQGAGTIINVLACVIKMNYGGTNVFSAASGQALRIAYDNADGSTIIKTAFTKSGLVASSNQIARTIPDDQTAEPYINETNLPIVIFNPITTEIGGNAANNNTIVVILTYQVLNV